MKYLGTINVHEYLGVCGHPATFEGEEEAYHKTPNGYYILRGMPCCIERFIKEELVETYQMSTLNNSQKGGDRP